MLALLVVASGVAVAADPPAAAAMRPPGTPGYLVPGSLDILAILPPAPTVGDVRYEADRKVFQQTRALEGSARWRMAADDALLSPKDLLRHFSCALDATIAPEQVPLTLRLLQRTVRDAGDAMNVAKDHYKRLRPYRIDTGATCRATEDLGDSFDYPSGHAMAGWAWAMVLAQFAPDRASPLLARGRAIGESRAICGLHNLSAVDAARTAATSVVVVLDATPAWQADAVAAKAEFIAARAAAPKPDPQSCATEAGLVAASID